MSTAGSSPPTASGDPLSGAPDTPAAAASAAGNDLVTRLLIDLRNGEEAALHQLLPLVYDELRQIARRQMRPQPDGHTLNTTALVHEAYFKLVGQRSAGWVDRAHFFGVAARAMRQVLINHAHKHATVKRGGGWRRVELDDVVVAIEEQADMLLALDEALTRLAGLNERLSRVVECRFFGGMAEEEVATALGITARTVRRDWLKAKLWLYSELMKDSPG